MTTRINSGQGALGRFLNDEAMGKSLGNTISNLEQTTGRMGKGDDTLGKLLTEQELYDRLSIDGQPARSGDGGAERRPRDGGPAAAGPAAL